MDYLQIGINENRMGVWCEKSTSVNEILLDKACRNLFKPQYKTRDQKHLCLFCPFDKVYDACINVRSDDFKLFEFVERSDILSLPESAFVGIDVGYTLPEGTENEGFPCYVDNQPGLAFASPPAEILSSIIFNIEVINNLNMPSFPFYIFD